MEIRKANIEDAPEIKALLEQLGYSSSVNSIVETINDPVDKSELFVAVSESSVLAFISLIYFFYFPSNCNVCRITGITVDSSKRGSGIGSQLIAFARKQGEKNGCKKLEVTTSLLRDKTQKYYEFLGFEKTSYKYVQAIGN